MSHWLDRADPADLTIVMRDGEIERIECRCEDCSYPNAVVVHIPWTPNERPYVGADYGTDPPTFHVHTYTVGWDFSKFEQEFREAEQGIRDMLDAELNADLARRFAAIINDFATDRHEPGSDGEVTLELGPAPASPGGMLGLIIDDEGS